MVLIPKKTLVSFWSGKRLFLMARALETFFAGADLLGFHFPRHLADCMFLHPQEEFHIGSQLKIVDDCKITKQ
jgi:hypothetical protein